VFGKHALRLKSHCAGGNCTVRVEITLVRVEITLVRVEITLERFEIKLVRVVIADLFFLSWVIFTIYYSKNYKYNSNF
jgi:hypothetical protein